MGDNGAADVGDLPDNQIDVVSGGTPRSPWKASAAASPVSGADSESWPALSDAQQHSKCNGGVDLNSAKSPPLLTPAVTDDCDDPRMNSAPVGKVSLLVCVNSVFNLLILVLYCFLLMP